jgi:hypothetical protein
MSGRLSNSFTSATRRFSPPDRFLTPQSPGGQRSASMATSTRLSRSQLTRTIGTQHADLSVRIELQMDVLQDLLVAVGLGQPRHVIDEFARHACCSRRLDEEIGAPAGLNAQRIVAQWQPLLARM